MVEGERHLVVVAHGGFAAGLVHAARMILGDIGIEGLDLAPGESPDSLARRLGRVLDRGAGEYVVMCDLRGGTPWNVAVREALAGRCQVVAGASLPLALALAEDQDVAEAAAAARAATVTLAEVHVENR